MRVPHAVFRIDEQAIHVRTQEKGTIVGIRRNGDELQYKFDCPDMFCTWLSPNKLSKLPIIQETSFNEEVEYKHFEVGLCDLKGTGMLQVGIVFNNKRFDKKFSDGQYPQAHALFDFLRLQESVSEAMIAAIGMG